MSAEADCEIHSLVLKGSQDAIKGHILSHPAQLDVRNEFGWSALHTVCSFGRLLAVEALLDSNANMDSIDKNGDTALHLACKSGNIRCAVLLASRGCDLNIRNFQGNLALHSVRRTVHDRIQKAASLSERLRDAVEKQRNDLVIRVLNQAFIWRRQTELWNDKNDTLLHEAIERGHLYTAVLLIKAGSDLTRVNNSGYNALLVAVACRQVKVAQILLARGADINAVDTKTRSSALHIAVLNNDPAMLVMLLGNGQLDASEAFMRAADSSYENIDCELVGILISEINNGTYGNEGSIVVANDSVCIGSKINVEQVDGMQRSALNLAVQRYRTELARILLAFGAGPNVPYPYSSMKTPVHMAVDNDSISMLDLLLSSGASVNVVDGFGQSPLLLAVKYGKNDFVNLLISYSADVNYVNRVCTRGSSAAAMGMDVFLEQSLIHVALRSSAPDVAIKLLNSGSHIHRVDCYGNTPLHLAVKYGYYAVVALLLDLGADISFRNNSYKTALELFPDKAAEYACMFGQAFSLRALQHRQNDLWFYLHSLSYEADKKGFVDLTPAERVSSYLVRYPQLAYVRNADDVYIAESAMLANSREAYLWFGRYRVNTGKIICNTDSYFEVLAYDEGESDSIENPRVVALKFSGNKALIEKEKSLRESNDFDKRFVNTWKEVYRSESSKCCNDTEFVALRKTAILSYDDGSRAVIRDRLSPLHCVVEYPYCDVKLRDHLHSLRVNRECYRQQHAIYEVSPSNDGAMIMLVLQTFQKLIRCVEEIHVKGFAACHITLDSFAKAGDRWLMVDLRGCRLQADSNINSDKKLRLTLKERMQGKDPILLGTVSDDIHRLGILLRDMFILVDMNPNDLEETPHGDHDNPMIRVMDLIERFSSSLPEDRPTMSGLQEEVSLLCAMCMNKNMSLEQICENVHSIGTLGKNVIEIKPAICERLSAKYLREEDEEEEEEKEKGETEEKTGANEISGDRMISNMVGIDDAHNINVQKNDTSNDSQDCTIEELKSLSLCSPKTKTLTTAEAASEGSSGSLGRSGNLFDEKYSSISSLRCASVEETVFSFLPRSRPRGDEMDGKRLAFTHAAHSFESEHNECSERIDRLNTQQSHSTDTSYLSTEMTIASSPPPHKQFAHSESIRNCDHIFRGESEIGVDGNWICGSRKVDVMTQTDASLPACAHIKGEAEAADPRPLTMTLSGDSDRCDAKTHVDTGSTTPIVSDRDYLISDYHKLIELYLTEIRELRQQRNDAQQLVVDLRERHAAQKAVLNLALLGMNRQPCYPTFDHGDDVDDDDDDDDVDGPGNGKEMSTGADEVVAEAEYRVATARQLMAMVSQVCALQDENMKLRGEIKLLSSDK